MKLASTTATIWCNSIESRHPWRTDQGLKGQVGDNLFYFRFDIGVSNFNNVNEFVSISELTQSRKDKINSKDIIESFLFRLFDSSVMLQIAEGVCTLRSLIDSGVKY